MNKRLKLITTSRRSKARKIIFTIFLTWLTSPTRETYHIRLDFDFRSDVPKLRGVFVATMNALSNTVLRGRRYL